MRLLRGIVLVVIASCATPASTLEDSAAKLEAKRRPPATVKSPGLRLPPGIKPLSNTLELTVRPGEERFRGTIQIEIDVTRPVEALFLNATGLTVEPTSLLTEQGKAPAEVAVLDDHVIAVVPRCLEDGTCLLSLGTQTVTLTFSGVLSKKDTDGLFQIREGDDWYAFTSFEPIDARRAFPHFDEPAFKVPWTVSLVVESEHAALSNMPQSSEEPLDGGLKRVRFAKSPPMPSYLVAMAVGRFEFVDAGRFGQKKTPIRIVTPKGKAGEAGWAAEVTGPILERLEAYFGSPYPYEKLDQIAIPAQTGAMENPGLVTYGLTSILSKPEQDSPVRKRGFAAVCTHELAHQWFGDLVTMAWWDDLWLNEAFATWMTPKILEGWQPTWAQDVAIVGRRDSAIGTDSLVNARQIRQPITSNDDIANAFDGITYSKGASVITMFEAWVGREPFQQGVRAYLGEHAWKNATADDFLGAISKAAGRDVAPAFRTFLDQPGAPLVSFSLDCPKQGAPVVTLRQRRVLPVGSTGDAAKTWALPLCLRWSEKGKERRTCTLLETATATLPLPDTKSCPEWVLPNDRYDGYYRSVLSGPVALPDVFRKAGAKLSMPERVGLLGDLGALVRSGDVDVSATLGLSEVVAKETDRHLFGYALGFASSVGGDFLPEALRPKHQAFVQRLFSSRLETLGWAPKPGEDEDTRLLRPSLLYTLGLVGKDPKVTATARRLVEQWIGDRKAIHPDVLDAVLTIAGDAGDAALHAKLLDAARAEKDRTERNRLIGAAAETADRGQVEANLALVLTDAFETREAMRFLWSAAGDFRTRDLALEYVKKNWDGLLEKLPKDSGARLVWLASGLCDEAQRDAAKAFFDGRSTKYLGGPRNFALVMEGIDLCLAYRGRQRPPAISFFEQKKP